jgi:O-antigen ligase
VLARLIVMNIQNKRDLQVVIGAILAGDLLQTAISVAQYITNNDFGLGLFTVGELRRVTGTLGWPNTLGAYGATVLLLSLALWISSQGGKWIWLMNIASFALVILSYSRGAWIATLLGALVVIWLCLQLLIPDANKILNRVFMIILIAAVIVALFSDSIFARVENISPEMDVLVTRARLNQIAYNMISAHPVMGVGQNNFMEVIRSYDTTGITLFNMEPVHNVFLLIAAETGLIGLILFILLLGAALLACWRVIKGRNRLLSATAIGLIGAMLAIIITNTADVHLRSDGFFAFFWCLLGLVMALENLSAQEANSISTQAMGTST